MSTQVTTQPTLEPVTLQEVKDWSRIAHNFEDGEIAALIKGLRRDAERWTGRQFFTATLTAKLDEFPDGNDPIILDFPPLQSVTSLQYVDEDGVTQTMAAADYVVDTASEPGKIDLAYGESWPTPRDEPNAITIVFIAGWSTIEAIPDQIKLYLRMACRWMLNNREGGEVPESFKWMLEPWRIVSDAL